MPLGKFGEVIGTMDTLGLHSSNHESKVVAPKNPKLLREKPAYIKLTPSEYLFKMSLDTQRKLQNTRVMELPQKLQLLDMANTTYQKNTSVSMEDPLFQPFPSSIFFVNCIPNEVYEIPLTLRNNDKVPRLVKVTLADSPYFKVVAPPNASHKVAAGLPIIFKVQFTPDHRQDYHLNLIVVTEREKFLVPIHCIGSRAILDFPDQISFPATPLKYNETKTILIRNIGNDTANFSLITKSPFSVEPSSGVLEVNESMQLVIQFTPLEPRHYDGEMVVQYETGEDVFVRLDGYGQEVSVRLEKPLIQVEETYVGLANLKTVSLHNRSDVMIHFYWSNFGSQEAEQLDRDTFLTVLRLEEEEERSRYLQDGGLDDQGQVLELLSSDKMSLVSRTYLNKKRLHRDTKTRFQDSTFSVDPVEGDLWPHTSLDITVAFKPTEARTYQTVAFCEVTGRETRLSLKMVGVAVGPKVEFSFRSLDMGFIFIHAHHSYEVVLANRGDIDALFKVSGSGSPVSRCFSFTPDDGLISPGSHQAIQIHFHSHDFLGDFQETFDVHLDGCLVPLPISFKGIVIGPTFNFNVHKIRFGDVSVGFPSIQEIVLTNSSLVPLQYKIRVPSDGAVDPLLASDLDCDHSPRDYCTRYQPREFSLNPSEATLAPMTSLAIAVTLTANSVGKYRTGLVVDVVGVGEDVFSLPISANAVVSTLEVSSHEMDFSRCFIKYPYIRSFSLTNSSNLPAKYHLLKQTEELTKVSYTSAMDKAVVHPHSKLDIPLELTALVVGELRSTVKIKVFGSMKEPLEVALKCFGEGPVVNISDIILDWGLVPVLERRALFLTMSNESEIPAHFSTNMMKEDSVYSVEPEYGVLDRHDSLQLKIEALLNDCVKFTDELHIHIEDSKTKMIPLAATGSGTTVEFDPPIPSTLDLGAYFSNSSFEKMFKITNKGKRHQQLVWSNDGYSYTKAMRQTGPNKSQIEAPVLTVYPHRFDLSPGESSELILKGMVSSPRLVHETILCHAIIGRQGGKELIKKVDLQINFVSPVVEFSQKKLHFRLDKSLFNEFEILKKSLTIRNVSGLTLNSKICLLHPFSLVDPEDPLMEARVVLRIKLETEEERTVLIQFDPLYETDFNTRTKEDRLKVSYDEHPHIDEIRLVGEVNFPNLEFDRLKVDFDCIINHSEVSQFLTMKNNSPLPVTYSWSLLIGDRPNIIFHRKRPSTSTAGIQEEEEGEYEDEEREEKEDEILDSSDKDKDTEKVDHQSKEEKEEEEDGLRRMSQGRKEDKMDQPQVSGMRLELSTLDTDGPGECDQEESILSPAKEKMSGKKRLCFLKKKKKAEDEKCMDQKPGPGRGGVNIRLKELLDSETEMVPLGIEEVFDVKPLYGTLDPGQVEQVTFTYFGHADIEAHATAICEVEGGPTYRCELSGEASTVRYEFSSLHFQFGDVLYDQVSFQEMVLKNTGKVGFEYTSRDACGILPGNKFPVSQPILSPICAFVPAGENLSIQVGYFPGSPGNFLDSCKIQVAHFPMESIELSGRATFPRVTIELPRDLGMFNDSSNVTFDHVCSTKTLFDTEDNFHTLYTKTKEEFTKNSDKEVCDLDIYCYLENVAVSNQPKKWETHPESKVSTKSPKKHLEKPSLPAYCLDFGNVILGQVQSRFVRTANTGKFPLSLKFIKNTMQYSGFFMNLNQVKNLPCGEEFQFEVNFDPRAANLSLGPMENVLILNILGGPLVPVRLTANITMPDIHMSCEIVDFDQVKVGQAKLVTIQLHNPTPVTTDWTTINGDTDSTFLSRTQKSTQSLFISKNKKKRPEEKKPLIFEMIPTAGELKPGQRLNVQIKFMPLEGKSYNSRLVMRLSQSSKRIVVKCVGTGLEPTLEFKEGYIVFGPVLPHSNGCEKIISVRNPCTFPIEFYSLEFDKMYLEDEKILRKISGYDEFGNMLIPPRMAGDKLPQEFIEFYEERSKKLQEGGGGGAVESGTSATIRRADIQEDGQISEIEEASVLKVLPPPQVSVPSKSVMSYNESESTALDDLEQTPVSQAIARYLGIELSPEGRAARRNRGIAIVVIGNPWSGKTETATKLAKTYSAALVTLDGIIIDAINMASTPSAQKARDLCQDTARRYEVFDMDDSQDKKSGAELNLAGSGTILPTIHGPMQAVPPHNRKTSTVSTLGRHPSKQSSSNKDHGVGEKADYYNTNNYLLCPSPPPLVGPPPSSKLNVSVLDGAGDSLCLMSCVLPDDVVIQIISERLMQPDCHKGVVFDGLDSIFTQNMSCSAQLILHALNNRRFMYFVTLRREFKSIKEEETEAEEEKLRLNTLEEEKELVWMTEMTEEEYEALDQDTQRRLEEKRLKARREKKKKEMEDKERERQMQEEYEAEVQRLKEEKAQKQKGGSKKVQGGQTDEKGKSRSGKDTALGKFTRENTSMNNKETSGVTALGDKHGTTMMTTERPESHLTEQSLEADDRKKKTKSLEKKSVGKIEELTKDGVLDTNVLDEGVPKDPKKEQEWLLNQRFKTFDQEFNKQIVDILALWDRAHPPMKQTASQGGTGDAGALENVAEENITARKGGTRMGAGPGAGTSRKMRVDHGIIHGTQQNTTTTAHSPSHEEGGDPGDGTIQEDPVGVTNIIIDVSKKSISHRTSLILSTLDAELPSADEVLEGLGLGPKGPPIPPAALFSIIHFPLKRKAPNMPEMFGENGHYNFLGTVEDKDDEKKDNTEKDDGSEKTKDDGTSVSSPTKSSRTKKNEVKDRLGNRKTSGKKSTVRRTSQTYTSPISLPTPISDDGIKAHSFRWVVQPDSEVNIRLRFKSDDLGPFDQCLNFELLDTRRKYQVFCRGICSFPNISKEPRIVFPHRQRNKEIKEIVHKKYIIDNDVFEFGPLLINKDKQRILDNKFPENVEEITIKNTSPMVADVNFSFLNDAKGDRFALSPTTMTLQPEESGTLTMWAFPRVAQLFEDAVVCCVKENPEPVMFQVSCLGVLPFLELDKKSLQFSKVLLHRKDMTSIYMKNPTCLGAFWQITGLESLGDEFSVAQDSGVIEPLTEFRLDAYFRAMKPYKANQKKNLRLEVYDLDRIAGILQTETIQVLAEAYDVALDMTFPKGASNRLDMGLMKVGDEAKQSVTLKNRGPYEVKFRFELEGSGIESGKRKYDLESMFTLSPAQGSLLPGDKTMQVQITFCAKEEVCIKDELLFKFHIIEPNVSESEETIAIIPIKISAKSVYSKYQITPKADINFGAVVVQTRKTRQIVLENVGEFDFKFSIHRAPQKQSGTAPSVATNKEVQPKDSTGVALSKMKPADTLLVGGSQARLQTGNFILYPATGVIPSKGSTIITVDCISDNPGRSDENLVIDVTDRNPRVDINGIQYRLFVEAFVPNIDCNNLASIFEEHRICDSLGTITKDFYQTCSGGIYGTMENKFMFTNVIVGSKVEARFRLENPHKVPCEISLSVKAVHGGRTSVGGRGSASVADIFEVEPARAQIEPRGSIYVCVVFSPPSMQQYLASFECNIEGLPPNSPYKSRALAFDLSGEGYLPRVSVTRPTLRNKKSQLLCLFKRSLLGRTQSQKVDLVNEGPLPCRVHVDVLDPDGVFWVSVGEDQSYKSKDVSGQKPHDLVLSMEVGSTECIDVFFRPGASGRYCANMKMTIVNNQYEDTIIQMVGEGYEDFISFDNLPPVEVTSISMVKVPPPSTGASSKNVTQVPGPTHEDVVDASKNNVLSFGDCYINCVKSISFCIINHSQDVSVRFSWPSGESLNPPVKFSPSLGHLHPGQSLNILASFMSGTPKSWIEKAIQCKIVKINVMDLDPGQKPLNWDDSKKTMKWVDSTLDGSTINSARKKKVIETEPEPRVVEVIETSRSLDLLVTANVDHCKCKCKTTEINFQDTMLFENRTYKFNLKNEGTVRMKYEVRVKVDECMPFSPRSSRPSTRGVMEEDEEEEEREDDQVMNPFVVEPMSGVICAGDKQSIQVHFSPLTINYFKATLVLEVHNLDPQASPPTITLTGRSVQPYCHFELTDSDYVTSGRRDPTMRGPNGAPPGSGLNPNTRVLELSVIGVSSREIRRFGLVNPTKKEFSFQWTCEDVVGLKGHSAILCLVPGGVVQAGRKSQCAFQFTSTSLGVTESFWRFEVPELGLSVPFLVVGHCTEPNVTFSKSHFKFQALLVGHESTECVQLMNFDPQPYEFWFQDQSRHAPGHVTSLRVEPMSGVVPALGSIQVLVGFQATQSQVLNFNLVCRVGRKTYPLTLNVKAEGYSVDCSAWIEGAGDLGGLGGNGDQPCEMVALSSTKSGSTDLDTAANCLDLGRLEVGEQVSRSVTLVNDGKFNFDFCWEVRWLTDPRLQAMLTLTPVSGTVAVGQRLQCELHLQASAPISFSRVQALLSVRYGPSYLLTVSADVRRPLLSFSFLKHDFGHCFVYRAGMRPLTATLVIQNKECPSSRGLTTSQQQRPVNVDCLTDSTEVLMHNFSATVLAPGASVEVEITFLPRRPLKYTSTLVFEINGICRETVEVSGTCEELKIETVSLPGHTLALGVLKVGEKISRAVKVANMTHVPVATKFVFSPSNESLQQRGIMKISPLAQEVMIQPKKANAVSLEVLFCPSQRIPKFTEEVYCESMGVVIPLFMISGGCYGYDIRLDMESISFGLVTKGSQLVKRLSMINYGDIGARFSWNLDAFKPDFSINPSNGYISPEMEVVFDVTFRPSKAAVDIRYENIECSLEGWKALPLTLTGVCQLVSPVKDSLNFSCAVRQQEMKSLKISNTTNGAWTLRPVIEGDHWSGAETLVVEALQVKSYEVTFHPLMMTQEGRKHVGSVFFAIPDGTGLLFNLTGNADPPKAIAKINRELPARTTYTEVLDISNWLKRPQRFKVIREVVKPEKSDSSMVLMKGFDFVDVPGGLSKQYKLCYIAQKEGLVQLKVTFMNESTGEYQFYDIQMKVFKPSSIARISLSSPVRQSVQHSILLENTSSAPITFQITSTSPDIHCSNQFQVQPLSKIPFSFEFFPLRVGESVAKLEISSPLDSGTICYDLDLVGTPPREELTLTFQTSLGSSQTLLAHFKNWTKTKTDFLCKIDNAKFLCDKSISVAPNVDAQLEVHFEPSKLGDHRAQLTIANTLAGEFVFPLLGRATAPKPQGPYTIKAGGTVSLSFKNVFLDNAQFMFQVDNPAFHLNKNNENIKSRKEHRIVVGFDGSLDGGAAGPVMGKLSVTCPDMDSTGALAMLQWVYYLRGVQKE